MNRFLLPLIEAGTTAMHRPILKFGALACAVGLAILPTATAYDNEAPAPATVQFEIDGPRLMFYPPKLWHSADGKTSYMTGISGRRMTPEWQERVMKTPPIQVTSNILSMYLAQ